MASLDRRRAIDAVTNVIETWGLSHDEAARLFGVSRQAARSTGIPRTAPAFRGTALFDFDGRGQRLRHAPEAGTEEHPDATVGGESAPPAAPGKSRRVKSGM